MFDIVFGLRNLSKSQLALLVLGFSVFGAMLTFCLALGPKLFQLQPGWVKSDAVFATVGIKGQNNELGRTSLKRLESFSTIPGLVDMATLGVQKSVNIRISEQEHQLSAALFSENFAQLLQAQGFEQGGELWATTVYLSHSFWLDTLQGNDSIIGQTLHLTDAQLPLKIAGVLPAEYDELLPEKPQIWLANNHSATLININFGANSPPESFIKTLKAQIAHEHTIQIGLLALTPGTTVDAIKRQYQSSVQIQDNEEGTQIYSDNRFSDIEIVAGINVTPNAKRQLQFQWWLIFGLSVALGLVNALNFLTGNIAQLVARQQEMNVRIAVGASQMQLLKTLVLEQLPLWVCSAAGIGILTHSSLALLTAYQYPLSRITPEFLLASWVATITFLALLIIAIVFYALWHIGRLKTFNRAKVGQQTPLQERLGYATIVLQLTLAGLALCLGVALTIEQSNKFEQLPFDKGLTELKLSLKDPNKGSNIDLNQLKQTLPQDVTFSVRQFVLPNALSMQFDAPQGGSGRKIGVNLMEVSDNYFTRLSAPMLAGNGFDGHSLVLNEAAARLLQPNAPLTLVGQSLRSDQANLLGIEDKAPIRVSAIVSNLPHYGVLNATIPLVYVNTVNVANDKLLQFSILYDATQAQEVKTAIQTVVQQQGNLNTAYLPLLKAQLEAQNSMMQQLVFLGLLFAGLICVLAAYSLYQQLTSHFKFEENNFGIMMAVGAQPQAIALMIWRSLGVQLAIAAIPVAVMLVWAQPYAQAQFQTDILNEQAIMLTAVAMTVIALLSSVRPCLKVVRRPIADLLLVQD